LTTTEIAEAIGGSLVDDRQAANRWQAKGLAFSPTRGAYVLIPPEFRTWRAVPASHFVDDMMRYLGHEYTSATSPQRKFMTRHTNDHKHFRSSPTSDSRRELSVESGLPSS
jgi:hypothetical protein